MRGLPRLPAEARGAVREDRGPAYRRGLRTFGARRGQVVCLPRQASQRQAEGDRGARAQGNPRAAGVPQQCRAGISDAGALVRHAVGRRKPAHPARVADRLRVVGRPVCAGRALDRAASARQSAAADIAPGLTRSRQHGDRGRARRRSDPNRGLCHRHGTGRGHPRRRDRGRRDCRPRSCGTRRA